MSAIGRKQPFRISTFQAFERPLWVKADTQIVPTEKPGGERLLYPRNQPLA
jgi:hypothetical protein